MSDKAKKSGQKSEEIGKTQNIFQSQCIQAKAEDIFQRFAKLFRKQTVPQLRKYLMKLIQKSKVRRTRISI